MSVSAVAQQPQLQQTFEHQLLRWMSMAVCTVLLHRNTAGCPHNVLTAVNRLHIQQQVCVSVNVCIYWQREHNF
jgi:hypothetical protein